MTDQDPQDRPDDEQDDDPMAQAREALAALVAQANRPPSRPIGRFWFWAAMFWGPIVAAGIVWVALTLWSPAKISVDGFDIVFPSGTSAQCPRDPTSPNTHPRYVCDRVP